MSEQEWHEVSLSHQERPIERRPAACVSTADIGAMLKKRSNDGHVSPPRAPLELAGVHDGMNERRPAAFVLAVYIGTAGKHVPEYINSAAETKARCKQQMYCYGVHVNIS